MCMSVTHSYHCNKHFYIYRDGQHLLGGGSTCCFVTLNKILAPLNKHFMMHIYNEVPILFYTFKSFDGLSMILH